MGCKGLCSSGGPKRQIVWWFILPSILLVVVIARTGEAVKVIDDRKIDDIRASIVQALGLKRIPNPAKANVSQTEYERVHKEYLTRLRRSAGGDARERKLFTMHAMEKTTHEGVTLSFPMTIENRESGIVESSLLRLLLDHNENSRTTGLEIRIFRKRVPGARRRLLSRRLVQEPETVRRRWLEFDLTDEDLNSDAPLHLLVQVLRKDFQKGTTSLAQNVTVSSAALNVQVAYPNHNSRIRRSLDSEDQLMSIHKGRKTECRGEARKCCRHRMTVHFKDLEGFDFIIQPKSFDAGFCKGRCPPRYNSAHHHAFIQSLVWRDNRKKVPKPCCAPSKLDQIEILYYDENEDLKLTNWKDMQVLECACS